MTIRSRLEKVERFSAGPSKVHVISMEGDDGEAAQDAYGREKIGPRDVVVLLRRGLGRTALDD